MTITPLNTPPSPYIHTETPSVSNVEIKLQRLAQQLGFYSVNYFFSVGVLVLMYPVSEKTIAPLLNTILPISHASLSKALLILTVMYWLPIAWDATRRWHENDF